MFLRFVARQQSVSFFICKGKLLFTLFKSPPRGLLGDKYLSFCNFGTIFVYLH